MANTASMGGRSEVAGLLAKSNELQKRILFVLGALIVFRLGTHIPVPGVDALTLSQVNSTPTGGLMDMLNMFTGGAMHRMALFSLGVMPYITASIIMQLMTFAYPTLSELKKEGEMGQRKITQYTRYLTILIAFGQGFAYASNWELQTATIGSETVNLIVTGGILFKLQTAFTLMTGTMFLMWLGEQITSRGIGQGVSVLIFAGIIAELPAAIYQTIEQMRVGAVASYIGLAVLAIALVTIFAVVFVETARRKVLVQYPKRNAMAGQQAEASYLPLKVNMGGVMPAIFASSVLVGIMTIINYYPNADWAQVLAAWVTPGQPVYMVVFSVMLAVLTFWWLSVTFNPEDTADNLKKQNGFVPGIRPGKATAQYFDYVLKRITFVGAAYLIIICNLPQVIINQFNIPANAAYLMGGTSLLIIVSVTIDLVEKIQEHLIAQKYQSMMKKSKFRRNAKVR
ncbi:MAG: preprotein translocase subunit SecY [Legionellales bacterium]|nr:preprotein translocase subunit SecY [Legionellales bacterium]